MWLVAWVDGAPAGYVGLVLDATRSPEEHGRVRGASRSCDYLFVEEPYRRRGIARALMLALEDRARPAACRA